MTKNNFNKITKVMVGDFPDHAYMKHVYENLSEVRIWKLYEKIAEDSKKDLDNLAVFYKDHGIEVFRPKFDPYITNKWSRLTFKPPFSLSDRFFAYGDLVFYLSATDDSGIPYFGFVRECLERMHSDGKYVFTNPLCLETTQTQNYTDADWPGDQGFSIDGPCFVPVENKILYNTKHCNTDRGIEWLQKVITKFYPETRFVDVSHKFTNHMDNQVRIFNERVATSNGSVGYIEKELKEIYPDITVIDTSVYEERTEDFRSKIFTKDQNAVREAEWLKAFIDFDDQNGNVNVSSVSIDPQTVVQTYNTHDLDKKLEAHGLKVETVSLRHSMFWGAGIPCETAVLEREAHKCE